MAPTATIVDSPASAACPKARVSVWKAQLGGLWTPEPRPSLPAAASTKMVAPTFTGQPLDEALEPELVELALVELEAVKPELVEPELVELEAVELPVPEPELVEPEPIELETVEPELVDSELVGLELLEMEPVEPELPELELLETALLEPELPVPLELVPKGWPAELHVVPPPLEQRKVSVGPGSWNWQPARRSSGRRARRMGQ